MRLDISTFLAAALTLSSIPFASCVAAIPRDDTSNSSLISMGWYASYHKQNLSLDDVSWSKYTHLSFYAA